MKLRTLCNIIFFVCSLSIIAADEVKRKVTKEEVKKCRKRCRIQCEGLIKNVTTVRPTPVPRTTARPTTAYEEIVTDESLTTPGPVTVIEDWERDKYCSILEQHTLCNHSGPTDNCGGSVITRWDISDGDKEEIITYHNKLRRSAVQGHLKGYNKSLLPVGGNINALTWGDELSLLAQGWADRCSTYHDCLDCRKMASRDFTGQNIYVSWRSKVEDTSRPWEKAIDSWWDEVQFMKEQDIHSFPDADQTRPETGHFTQVVWGSTQKVGCGIISYAHTVKKHAGTRTIIICNYWPAGNLVRFPVYQVGEPCSGCPRRANCTRQEGLCHL